MNKIKREVFLGAREIGSDGKTQEERQRDRDEYRLENAVPGGFWIRLVAVLIDGYCYDYPLKFRRDPRKSLGNFFKIRF